MMALRSCGRKISDGTFVYVIVDYIPIVPWFATRRPAHRLEAERTILIFYRAKPVSKITTNFALWRQILSSCSEF